MKWVLLGIVVFVSVPDIAQHKAFQSYMDGFGTAWWLWHYYIAK